jgi:signal peptidase II
MNIIFGIIFTISVFIDQLTKKWAVDVLKDSESIKIIGDFLNFSYIENRGAAFGMLQNKLWLFIIVTAAMIILLGYMYFRIKNITNLSRLSIVMIVSGAIGNLIDRVRLRYVVDFIHVRFGNFYDFPVFNIADSLVVCGTFLMVILILFNKFEKSEK